MANLKYLRIDYKSFKEWGGAAPMLEKLDIVNVEGKGFTEHLDCLEEKR